MSWDFNANNGELVMCKLVISALICVHLGNGNWTDEGCLLVNSSTSTGEFICECDHLTNFAVLVVSIFL